MVIRLPGLRASLCVIKCVGVGTSLLEEITGLHQGNRGWDYCTADHTHALTHNGLLHGGYVMKGIWWLGKRLERRKEEVVAQDIEIKSAKSFLTWSNCSDLNSLEMHTRTFTFLSEDVQDQWQKNKCSRD